MSAAAVVVVLGGVSLAWASNTITGTTTRHNASKIVQIKVEASSPIGYLDVYFPNRFDISDATNGCYTSGSHQAGCTVGGGARSKSFSVRAVPIFCNAAASMSIHTDAGTVPGTLTAPPCPGHRMTPAQKHEWIQHQVSLGRRVVVLAAGDIPEDALSVLQSQDVEDSGMEGQVVARVAEEVIDPPAHHPKRLALARAVDREPKTSSAVKAAYAKWAQKMKHLARLGVTSVKTFNKEMTAAKAGDTQTEAFQHAAFKVSTQEYVAAATAEMNAAHAVGELYKTSGLPKTISKAKVKRLRKQMAPHGKLTKRVLKKLRPMHIKPKVLNKLARKIVASIHGKINVVKALQAKPDMSALRSDFRPNKRDAKRIYSGLDRSGQLSHSDARRLAGDVEGGRRVLVRASRRAASGELRHFLLTTARTLR